jgi:putative membrane protein
MNQTRRQGGGKRVVAIIVLLVLLGVAASVPAAGHTDDDGVHHHDGWTGPHNSDFGYLWMALWPVVLIGVPLALGYLLFIRRGSASGGEASDDALAILRRRYAQGEIDDEEFDSRRRKLQAEE